MSFPLSNAFGRKVSLPSRTSLFRRDPMPEIFPMLY